MTHVTEAKVEVRDPSLDVARGLAVIGLVLGHVLFGAIVAGVSVRGGWAGFTNMALGLWRLPVFVFVSGLFVSRSFDRHGVVHVWNRVALCSWLYLLWTVIQGGTKAAMGNLVNDPVTWWQVLELWIPQGQLWYLPWLLVMTLLSALVKPWLPGRIVPTTLVSGALALATWGYEWPYILTRGLSLPVFFFLGCWVGIGRYQRVLRATKVWVVAAVGCLAGGVYGLMLLLGPIPPTAGVTERTALGVAAGVVGSVSGLTLVLMASRGLARLPAASGLAWLGERTLPIFIAHILPASGTRVVLMKLGIRQEVVLIVLSTAAGVLVPAVLWVVSARWFPWLFQVPARWSRAIMARAAHRALPAVRT